MGIIPTASLVSVMAAIAEIPVVPEMPVMAMEPEKGAATAEYAMVLVAACGFAAVLFAVIKSDLVRTLVINLIKGAMELKKG